MIARAESVPLVFLIIIVRAGSFFWGRTKNPKECDMAQAPDFCFPEIDLHGVSRELVRISSPVRTDDPQFLGSVNSSPVMMVPSQVLQPTYFEEDTVGLDHTNPHEVYEGLIFVHQAMLN
jgi:hypothetical protein